MAEYQNPNRTIVPRSGGFFQDMANRFRLVGRLMMDDRVNTFLKILPIGTLIYVISPIDILSLNPMDDAFVIWAGTTLFVELCPPDVVEEHLKSLRKVVTGQWKDFSQPAAQDEVVDGEYFETDASGRRRNPTR